MDLITTDPSVLIEMIKEQNLVITSLRKAIEELNTDSKILREQVDYLTKKLFGTKSEKTCGIDGDTLHYAGKKYMRSEIEYIPATMKLIHIYEENWECRTCRKEGRGYLKQAKMDPALLQHSMASPSSVAWTMYQKYANHVPLYRQEKDWQNHGMEIKRSILSNWIIKTSEEWLARMTTKLHEELLKDNYLHADETPCECQVILYGFC